MSSLQSLHTATIFLFFIIFLSEKEKQNLFAQNYPTFIVSMVFFTYICEHMLPLPDRRRTKTIKRLCAGMPRNPGGDSGRQPAPGGA